MRTISTIACLCFAITVTDLLHAAEPSAPKKLVSVEGMTEYQLDNGLRLLLYPDNSRSKVDGEHDRARRLAPRGYGETGMAHLLEHMVFKGTPRHPNIQRRCKSTAPNSTAALRPIGTNYYETEPADDDNLEFALDLEADRLSTATSKKRNSIGNDGGPQRIERGENSPPVSS